MTRRATGYSLPIGDLALERGGVLPDVTVAYETWGTLSPSGDNAVLVEHALTGDSHVVGEPGPGHVTSGWWPGLIGPGAPLDTDRLFVVASNVLGGCQGTTGPASAGPDGRPWGGRFPFVTIRDQVAAEVALADALGIGRWHGVLGGSMGGMRVLEWVGRRSPTGWSARWSWRRRHTRRPTRWPGASRSSSPSAATRPSAEATTTTPRTGP